MEKHGTERQGLSRHRNGGGIYMVEVRKEEKDAVRTRDAKRRKASLAKFLPRRG